jgi:hypothetical protein
MKSQHAAIAGGPVHAPEKAAADRYVGRRVTLGSDTGGFAMAQFDSGGDNTLKRTLGDEALGGLSARELTAHDIPGTARMGAEHDFLGSLERVAREARERAAARVPAGLHALDADWGLAPTGGSGPETNAARLLRRSRELLAEGLYREALGPLGELLRQEPAHPEALYLSAQCHAALDAPREALRALAPLRSAPLTDRLATQVQALRQEVRAAFVPRLVADNCALLREDRWEEVLKQTDELPLLDPDVWEFYYLKGAAQILSGALGAARDTAGAGLAVCPDRSRDLLLGLRAAILDQLLRQRLSQALSLYKQGRYPQARAELQSLGAEAADSRLCATFGAYLALLEARGAAGPADTPPEGSAEEVEQLHFFLVAEELPLVRRYYAEDRYPEACELAQVALRHAPHFPYLHYLLALSLYFGLRARLDGDETPGLDEMAEVLAGAARHAQAALADPELTQAPDLAGAIADLARRVEAARQERDLGRTDGELFNPCVEAYTALIKSAEDGVNSPAQVRELHLRLSALRERVAGVSGQLQTAEGQEKCRDLAETITRVLARLDEIGQGMTESESVSRLYRRFDAELREVRGGIPRENRLAVAQRFVNLFLEAGGVKRSLKSSEAREAVDKLLDALRDVVGQLSATELLTKPVRKVTQGDLFRTLIGE